MTASADRKNPAGRPADRESNRICGAAALAAVYRSLAPSRAAHALEEHPERRSRGTDRRTRSERPPGGVERRQAARRLADLTPADIFPRVSKPNRFGSLACATHLMVKDALSRGLSAVAVQVPYPLLALMACRANGIRTILNHRLRLDSPAGHYTVLAGMDSETVTLDDPTFGGERRVSHAELLELWQPRGGASEIVGNFLIGVADQPPRIETCPSCRVPVPAEVPCPKCAASVPLAPAALLGCIGGDCLRRSWSFVCCPSCDFTWSFQASVPETEPKPEEGLWNLGPFFAELDRFKAHVLSVPGAALRSDVRQQLASIDENREKLRLAEREEIARQGQRAAASSEEAARLRQEEAAVEKAREEATKPAAPLDGGALGDALLKDLGIVR